LPYRFEIIKFLQCSRGASGTSNHPRLGNLHKDPCVWNCYLPNGQPAGIALTATEALFLWADLAEF